MDIREEFEKLDEIAKKLSASDGVYWSSHHGYYNSLHEYDDYDVGFVNGAWYAFQEQQEKIDAIVSIVRDADLSDGNSSVAIVHDEIQELLK